MHARVDYNTYTIIIGKCCYITISYLLPWTLALYSIILNNDFQTRVSFFVVSMNGDVCLFSKIIFNLFIFIGYEYCMHMCSYHALKFAERSMQGRRFGLSGGGTTPMQNKGEYI